LRLPVLIAAMALLLLGCASHWPIPSSGTHGQVLTIRWQRLVNAEDETCPRCASTGEEVRKAVAHLKRSLAPAGLGVVMEIESLDEAAFARAPLESNRIWIGDHSLEEWLGAQAASSPCCAACGDKECRTVCVGGEIYEAIPAELIVRAGFLAAGEALRRDGGVADSAMHSWNVFRDPPRIMPAEAMALRGACNSER
jgi:hypothetical protein